MASASEMCKFCNLEVSMFTCPRCQSEYCSATCYKDPKHLECSEEFYRECVRSCLSKNPGSCDLEASKYTCPKCQSEYCSLTCYKDPKHLECSEEFYRECVMLHLSQKQSSPDAKNEMLRTLQKLENEDQELDLENDIEDDFAERFSDLDLEGDVTTEQLWSRLTEEEKMDFERRVENGGAADLVPIWTPWWFHKEKLKLVAEIGEPSEDLPESRCPSLPSRIPALKELFRGTVAPNIKYDVINALYAYAFTMQLYNGEYCDLFRECASKVMDISGSLTEGGRWSSSEEAIVSAMQQARKIDVLQRYDGLSVEAIEALICILNGPSIKNRAHYALCALGDIENLFKLARRSCDKVKDKELRTSLGLIIQKLTFYLGWISQNHTCLILLVPELELLYEKHKVELRRFAMESNLITSMRAGSSMSTNTPKIQEID